jgi:hypothetical protein
MRPSRVYIDKLVLTYGSVQRLTLVNRKVFSYWSQTQNLGVEGNVRLNTIVGSTNTVLVAHEQASV